MICHRYGGNPAGCLSNAPPWLAPGTLQYCSQRLVCLVQNNTISAQRALGRDRVRDHVNCPQGADRQLPNVFAQMPFSALRTQPIR
jgi:hypothetical protein